MARSQNHDGQACQGTAPHPALSPSEGEREKRRATWSIPCVVLVEIHSTQNSEEPAHSAEVLRGMPLATGWRGVLIHLTMTQMAEPAPAPLAYIIDDEPMLLDLNEAVLRGIGFDVRRFRAAEIALEAYKVAPIPPAIIVTDYSMHRMTGIELIECCRQLHPGQKVLMVSGTVGESAFQNAPQKPDEFLSKPYSTERFANLVKALVGL